MDKDISKDIKDITLTHERYFQHKKIKFVFLSGHVMFCLFHLH